MNQLLLHYAGEDHRSVFYDIDEVCPQLRELERVYLKIRIELDALLAQRTPMPRMVNNAVLWGLAVPLYGKKVIEKVKRYNGDLL